MNTFLIATAVRVYFRPRRSNIWRSNTNSRVTPVLKPDFLCSEKQYLFTGAQTELATALSQIVEAKFFTNLFFLFRFLVTAAAAASILLHFRLEFHFQCSLFTSAERRFRPPRIECVFLFTIDWIFGAESESIEFYVIVHYPRWNLLPECINQFNVSQWLHAQL